MKAAQSTLAERLEQLADTLERKAAHDERRYVFDPVEDVSLSEVVQILRLLNLTTLTSDYLAMPMNLRRLFKPVDLPD